MPRLILVVFCAGLVAGCLAVDRDPSRTLLGVSAARPAMADPAAPDAATPKVLEWKVSQICTNGDDTMAQEVEAAEDNQQIVDRQLRCRAYRFMSPLPF